MSLAWKIQQEVVQQYEIITIRGCNECSLPTGWCKCWRDVTWHDISQGNNDGCLPLYVSMGVSNSWGEYVYVCVCVCPCVELTPWVGWGLQVWSQKTLWPPRTGRCRPAAEWGPVGAKDSRRLITQTDKYNHFCTHRSEPEPGLHKVTEQAITTYSI